MSTLSVVKIIATLLTGIIGTMSFGLKTKRKSAAGEDQLTLLGKVLFVLLPISGIVAVVTQSLDLQAQAAADKRAQSPLRGFQLSLILEIPVNQPAVQPFADRMTKVFEAERQAREDHHVDTVGDPPGTGLVLAPGWAFPEEAGSEGSLRRFFLDDVSAFVTLATPRTWKGENAVGAQNTDIDLDLAARSPISRFVELVARNPAKRNELPDDLELPGVFRNQPDIYYTLPAATPRVRRNTRLLSSIADLADGYITVAVNHPRVNVRIIGVSFVLPDGYSVLIDKPQASRTSMNYALFHVPKDILERAKRQPTRPFYSPALSN